MGDPAQAYFNVGNPLHDPIVEQWQPSQEREGEIHLGDTEKEYHSKILPTSLKDVEGCVWINKPRKGRPRSKKTHQVQSLGLARKYCCLSNATPENYGTRALLQFQTAGFLGPPGLPTSRPTTIPAGVTFIGTGNIHCTMLVAPQPMPLARLGFRRKLVYRVVLPKKQAS